MKWALKNNESEADKKPKTKDPWFLESVENGLKATNVREGSSGIRPNKPVPIKYFEYDRLFGVKAYSAPLKVMEMFGELQEITPNTKGFIFGQHKYLYHEDGILRRNYKTGNEAYISGKTLLNESVSCYLGIMEPDEQSVIKSAIRDLHNATTSDTDQADSSRKRIPHSDS